MTSMNKIGRVDLALVYRRLDEQDWTDGCPRIELGLVCMRDAYECVCSVLTGYKAAVGFDRSGRASQLAFLLNGKDAGSGSAVIAHLERVAFAASIGLSGRTVEVSYDLALPQNTVLVETLRKRERRRAEAGRVA